MQVHCPCHLAICCLVQVERGGKALPFPGQSHVGQASARFCLGKYSPVNRCVDVVTLVLFENRSRLPVQLYEVPLGPFDNSIEVSEDRRCPDIVAVDFVRRVHSSPKFSSVWRCILCGSDFQSLWGLPQIFVAVSILHLIHGYSHGQIQPPPQSKLLTHLTFMDDLKVYAESRQ